MRDFRGIIDFLKAYMAEGREKKVYDKDVAQALELSQAQFATLKKRNSIPYAQLIKFSKLQGLCCYELFFDGA